jgi:hypothetical protein
VQLLYAARSAKQLIQDPEEDNDMCKPSYLSACLLLLLPAQVAASGSGGVSLSSKYLILSVRSPHKIPMRGRYAEYSKQIDRWKAKTRPKLKQIKRQLDRYLRKHRSVLRRHGKAPCAKQCKALDVRISRGLMRFDWTSYYRVQLALRLPLNAARVKRLTDQITELVRQEHVVANIKALPRSPDGDLTLYDTVAGEFVRRYDGKTFAAVRRRLPKKRARLLLNYAYLQAANRNKPALLSVLLKLGAQKGFRNKARYNDTAAHLAASAGHVKIIELLVKTGAKVDLPNEFEATPLLNAIRGGRLSVARALIKHGANVNHIKQKYWTPLHAAAALGSVPMVELLLKNKARCIKVGKNRSCRDLAKKQGVRKLLEAVPVVRIKR